MVKYHRHYEDNPGDLRHSNQAFRAFYSPDGAHDLISFNAGLSAMIDSRNHVLGAEDIPDIPDDARIFTAIAGVGQHEMEMDKFPKFILPFYATYLKLPDTVPEDRFWETILKELRAPPLPDEFLNMHHQWLDLYQRAALPDDERSEYDVLSERLFNFFVRTQPDEISDNDLQQSMLDLVSFLIPAGGQFAQDHIPQLLSSFEEGSPIQRIDADAFLMMFAAAPQDTADEFIQNAKAEVCWHSMLRYSELQAQDGEDEPRQRELTRARLYLVEPDATAETFAARISRLVTVRADTRARPQIRLNLEDNAVRKYAMVIFAFLNPEDGMSDGFVGRFIDAFVYAYNKIENDVISPPLFLELLCTKLDVISPSIFLDALERYGNILYIENDETNHVLSWDADYFQFLPGRSDFWYVHAIEDHAQIQNLEQFDIITEQQFEPFQGPNNGLQVRRVSAEELKKIALPFLNPSQADVIDLAGFSNRIGLLHEWSQNEFPLMAEEQLAECFNLFSEDADPEPMVVEKLPLLFQSLGLH